MPERQGRGLTRFLSLLPPVRTQDIWAIYTRTCIGQALEISREAALNEDPDIEATESAYVQGARPAPRR
tara:strand:- start:135 stop:341 length:207 start_codon:yes stop_codon:yes gene_type:complete